MKRNQSKSKSSRRGAESSRPETAPHHGRVTGGEAAGESRRAQDANVAAARLPSVTARTWLSIWVCVHLLALALSFTSVVEPSSLQVNLSGMFFPYLRLGHFAADDRPVYLAHGTADEQPHRLEITSDTLSEIGQVNACQWRTVGAGDYAASESSPGMAVCDRVARFLSTSATLAGNDQPGVVAELLLPIAAHFSEAKAIRIVRFPTDLSDVNATSESPYVARIVRSADSVALIQLKPERQSSQPVSSPEGPSQ